MAIEREQSVDWLGTLSPWLEQVSAALAVGPSLLQGSVLHVQIQSVRSELTASPHNAQDRVTIQTDLQYTLGDGHGHDDESSLLPSLTPVGLS